MTPLIEVLHGVNFDLLELRDPALYGGLSLAELEQRIAAFAQGLGLEARCAQTNDEGEFVGHLHRIARAARAGGPRRPAGLVLNPGAWTHYAWAIHDALELVGLPAVEVHLSDPARRDPWRAESVVRDLCIATVAGHGVDGYRLALERLRGWLEGER